MRNLSITLLFFWLTVSVSAQKLEPYIYTSATLYRHSGFDGNTFGKVDIGGGLLSNFWVAPEFGGSIVFGSPESPAVYKPGTPTFPLEKIDVRYSSWTFNLGPKIRLTKQEDFWVYFLPKYHFGQYRIAGNYYEIDDAEHVLELKEGQAFTEALSYLDFTFGFEAFLNDAENLSAAFFLAYTATDLPKGFENLKFEATDLRPQNREISALGIGARLQFHF